MDEIKHFKQNLRAIEEIKYLEGAPLIYRTNCSVGMVMDHKNKAMGDTFLMTPIAWRVFSDDLYQKGHRKWIEFFFINEKGNLTNIAIHGISAEEFLKETLSEIYYEGKQMSELVFQLYFEKKKGTDGDQEWSYFICRFSIVDELDEETINHIADLTKDFKLYRSDSITQEATEHQADNYHFLSSETAIPQAASSDVIAKTDSSEPKPKREEKPKAAKPKKKRAAKKN